VLRNFSDVSQLKGLENNNDDVAINIKLKSGKEFFGLELLQELILVNVISSIQIFYYSPKTSINLLTNFIILEMCHFQLELF
jgi:hypothetical protein